MRYRLRAILLAFLTLAAPCARAAEPAKPVINPPPTAKDWADLAKLPDWSGVWNPKITDQDAQARTNMPPWNAKAAALVAHQLAFSSASWCATSAAAFAFHGGMLVLACASWSVIFGFHTPLQSGSFARSAQSRAAGGGLMTGFSGSAAQTEVLIAIKRARVLMGSGY